MTSKTTRAFRDLLARLPKSVQTEARDAYRMFVREPFHSGLQFKQVIKDPPVWSVRIGLHHRALGVRRPYGIAWFWIGTHAEYDHILRRL